MKNVRCDDIYSLKWVSDPQVSPDGQTIAYVVKSVDQNDKSRYQSRIWMVKTSGGTPYPFSSGTKSDTSPRWSPDGKSLAFISNRNGDNQIWLAPVHGGEPRQLTSFKRPLANISWSPDGSHLLATSRIGPSDDAAQSDKSDVKVITRLHYKMNGEGFHGDRRSHIVVVEVNSGTVRQLTEGDFDHTSPTWSPDGQTVVFSAKRYDNADYVQYSDLYSVPIAGGTPVKLTASFGPCSSPRFSPDGETIAFYSHDMAYKGATLTDICLMSASGGEVRPLIKALDRGVGNHVGSDMVSSTDNGPQWSADGQHIYFSVTNGGTTHVYRVDVRSGAIEQVTAGEHVVYGFHLVGDTLALVITSPTNPGDLFVSSLSKAGEAKLTDINKAYLADLALSTPERITFQGYNGVAIEGWLMKPIGFTALSQYPLILEIHGGPHAAYGLSFMHEFQVLTARGYAVLFTNPQGSLGYGQAFNAATHHDWGGKDYHDLMAAVDYACSLSFVDSKRLGVIGGSYGGFMVNWMVGHTNRFCVAVTERSTSNRYSQFGSSDVGYFNGEFEFNGNPWDNPEHYLERSPISYVRNITTPLLIVHSEQDYRCPMEQAEQLYTALKWLGKDTMFIRFPDENHELSRSGKPTHRVERLKHISSWFEKYLGC